MVEYIRKLKYVKSEIILIVDTLLSTIASIFAYSSVQMMFDEPLNVRVLATLIPSSATITAALILIFRLHKDVVRHFSIYSLFKISAIALIKSVLLLLLFSTLFVYPHPLFTLKYCAMFGTFFTATLLIAIRALSIGVYYSFLRSRSRDSMHNALLYSISDTNPEFVEYINNNPSLGYNIRGFLTKSDKRLGLYIHNKKVYSAKQSEQELKRLFDREQIRCVIFPSLERFKSERDNVVKFCMNHKVKMLISGTLIQAEKMGNIEQVTIKPIQIEDLLGRKEIAIDIESVKSELTNKCVMVTGAAGSIGSEIVNQLAQFNIKKLVLLDVAETPLHELLVDIQKRYPNLDLAYKLGDVRSQSRVNSLIKKYRPAIIFHAAAYKHVPLVEKNPCEGIMTNVWGTINMANAAIKYGVEKFVMISTDKAVNPTNVMGATKRLAEMCVQRISQTEGSACQFITTRFGNVLGSNGSVIPLFRRQIESGGPITVTHPDIIRYFMTIPEACRLVLQAATMGSSGSIFLFDMGEQVKIVDLARTMIQLSGLEPDVDIKIEFTGLRPGEKLYEELLTVEELTQATSHAKIRMARCSAPDVELLESKIKRMILFARNLNVSASVSTLKELVPEFISKNSEFEMLDRRV